MLRSSIVYIIGRFFAPLSPPPPCYQMKLAYFRAPPDCSCRHFHRHVRENFFADTASRHAATPEATVSLDIFAAFMLPPARRDAAAHVVRGALLETPHATAAHAHSPPPTRPRVRSGIVVDAVSHARHLRRPGNHSLRLQPLRHLPPPVCMLPVIALPTTCARQHRPGPEHPPRRRRIGECELNGTTPPPFERAGSGSCLPVARYAGARALPPPFFLLTNP